MYKKDQVIEWEAAEGSTMRGRIFDVPDDETLHVVVVGEEVTLVLAELKSRPRIIEAE